MYTCMWGVSSDTITSFAQASTIQLAIGLKKGASLDTVVMATAQCVMLLTHDILHCIRNLQQ